MRPATELAVAVGIVTVLGVVAAAAGSRGQRPQDDDVRRSTYLTGPHGARAYAEALELLGVPVVRLRARTTALAGREGADELYAALDPSAALSPLDALHLRRYAANGGRLLLAGAGAVPAMQCFGQVVLPRFGGRALLDGDTLRIGAVLQAPQAPAPRRGLMLDDGSAVACPPFPLRAVDTLLAATDGEPVVLRIASDSAGTAILVADGTLFSNRVLRTTAAGELALSLAAGAGAVVVDEYHHGFGPSGGMLSAVRRWSASSPWGWALWQLAVVGVLALLAGAVRFGPARRVIERRRRSPLEHVRALATALAAARGHAVAIGLLVRGLRRRLARPGESVRGDPGAWLASLAHGVRTPAGLTAVATLQTLTRGPADADGVRRAALAVEDLWQEMKP